MISDDEKRVAELRDEVAAADWSVPYYKGDVATILRVIDAVSKRADEADGAASRWAAHAGTYAAIAMKQAEGREAAWAEHDKLHTSLAAAVSRAEEAEALCHRGIRAAMDERDSARAALARAEAERDQYRVVANRLAVSIDEYASRARMAEQCLADRCENRMDGEEALIAARAAAIDECIAAVETVRSELRARGLHMDSDAAVAVVLVTLGALRERGGT